MATGRVAELLGYLDIHHACNTNGIKIILQQLFYSKGNYLTVCMPSLH